MAARLHGVLARVPRWRIGGIGSGRAIKEAVAGCVEHDVFGLAAEIAYRAALTILPFLLVVAGLPWVVQSVFSVPDVAQRISDEAGRHLSNNAASMIRTLVEEVDKSPGWTAVTIGLVGSLAGGISSMSALRKALNRIYGFKENQTFLKRKALELGLTLSAGSLALAAMLCILLGPHLLDQLGAPADLVSIGGAVTLILIAVSLIYWLLPAHESADENTFRWITPGAVLFGTVWIGFSLVFSAYLSSFGTVNQVYGSVGVMIVLLVWLYGSNLALLAGAEINASIGRQVDPGVNDRSPSPMAIEGQGDEGRKPRPTAS
jgi:membrane protein